MSNNDGEKALAGVGTIIGLFGLLLLLAIYGGWVLSVMWGWFIVPIFGLPYLSIAEAIGVMLVVGLFKSSGKSDKYGTSETIAALLSPLFMLAAGYIVHLFM